VSPCDAPLSLADLAAYHIGEIEPEAIEEHYFGCAECTRRLEMVALIAQGVVDLMARGGVSASVTDDFVSAAERQGLVLRTYRLAPGDEVACTVAPDEDFVVVRLGVNAAQGEQIDLEAQIHDVDRGTVATQRTEDVPFQRARGEIVYVYAGDLIRSLPRTRWSLRARLRGPAGIRDLGPYVLDHTPWDQLPART
jgi:hypothetical protein